MLLYLKINIFQFKTNFKPKFLQLIETQILINT